jgi:pimeloyl-ACP methyl ester carboxylesterase
MAKLIFMIHGMWGGSWYWENYRHFFEANGYQCVAPDLPFHKVHPQSEPTPELGSVSLLDYVEFLEKEIEKLPAEPIVMGHSMGGLLAQMLASRGRINSKALVLLTPAAPAGIMAITLSSFRSFLSIQLRWGFWRKPVRQTFGEAVYSMLHLLSSEDQRKAYEKLVYESGRAGWEMGYWFLGGKHTTRIDEATVTCPILIIAGKLDRITPVSVVEQIYKKYQAVATYRIFEDHAHWVVAEPGWEEVANAVLVWLKDF